MFKKCEIKKVEEKMQNLKKCFKEHPIIASIRNDKDLKYALNTRVTALFILHGDIFNLPPDYVRRQRT